MVFLYCLRLGIFFLFVSGFFFLSADSASGLVFYYISFFFSSSSSASPFFSFLGRYIYIFQDLTL